MRGTATSEQAVYIAELTSAAAQRNIDAEQLFSAWMKNADKRLQGDRRLLLALHQEEKALDGVVAFILNEYLGGKFSLDDVKKIAAPIEQVYAQLNDDILVPECNRCRVARMETIAALADHYHASPQEVADAIAYELTGRKPGVGRETP